MVGNPKLALRKFFEEEILTRPLIIDDDLDSYLCLAYINSKLKKKVIIAMPIRIPILLRKINRATTSQKSFVKSLNML